MKLFEPASDFVSMAVQNAMLIACLVYIAAVFRLDVRLLVRAVYAAIVILAGVQILVEMLQGRIDEDDDE